MLTVALTIAGSDPSGGAGIQADLKTFHRFGVYGTAAISLLTVQNTLGISKVVVLDSELVAEQIDAVLSDLSPAAVKTGALGSADIIRAVAGRMRGRMLVVDPVLTGSDGSELTSAAALKAMQTLLLPVARLVTPNLAEAAAIAGMEVGNVAEMREAARRIAGFGVEAVLVKGGHLAGDAIDVLFCGGVFNELRGERVMSRHTHGTGCTLSAAITALLGKGIDMGAAVLMAKRYVAEGIRSAPGLGAGAGPLNHWAELLNPDEQG